MKTRSVPNKDADQTGTAAITNGSEMRDDAIVSHTAPLSMFPIVRPQHITVCSLIYNLLIKLTAYS